MAFLDGVTELVQRNLVRCSVVIGGVVGEFERLIPKAVMLEIHKNAPLLLRKMASPAISVDPLEGETATV